MPINKMINNLKKLNDDENAKSKFNMKNYMQEIKEMGWKKFWKANNKVFYFVGTILAGLILINILLNSKIVTLFKTDDKWASFYFLGTTLLFTGFTVYMINFLANIGLKQEFNTDNFFRTKEKLKGVDWKSAEEPYLKKKKQS